MHARSLTGVSRPPAHHDSDPSPACCPHRVTIGGKDPRDPSATSRSGTLRPGRRRLDSYGAARHPRRVDHPNLVELVRLSRRLGRGGGAAAGSPRRDRPPWPTTSIPPTGSASARASSGRSPSRSPTSTRSKSRAPPSCASSPACRWCWCAATTAWCAASRTPAATGAPASSARTAARRRSSAPTTAGLTASTAPSSTCRTRKRSRGSPSSITASSRSASRSATGSSGPRSTRGARTWRATSATSTPSSLP